MKKILIVEDDQDFSLALSFHLKSSGYQPLMAIDSMMGVSMALREQPDLVLLDITTPDADGFSIAKCIRTCQDKGIANVPIIFLTASKSKEFHEKAFEHDALYFFEKNYDAKSLLAAIGKALN